MSDGWGALVDGHTPSSTFFVNSIPMRVSDLLAAFPASAATLGMYARVSDLYGSVDDIMRVGRSGGIYYWRPQRSDYTQSITITGGLLAYSPLLMPPSLSLQGTLASNASISLAAEGAWPGAQFDVANDTLLGAFTLNVTGLAGNTIKNLGLNARFTARFDGASWRAF